MRIHWLLCLMLFGVGAFSQEYIGTSKCGKCHKKEDQGAQLKVWEDTAHASAFETLKSEDSVKIAKEKGLTVPPHEAPECLSCHTTGYGKGGYEVKDESFYQYADDDKEGKKAANRMEGLRAVGCEACHGAGSEYKSKKVMKAIFAGEQDGKEVGLVKPDEAVCKGCHNEDSPTFESFNFDEASKEIAHPYPEGYDPGK